MSERLKGLGGGGRGEEGEGMNHEVERELNMNHELDE